MIAAVATAAPTPREYPRYRLMDPDAMHLGELFELRHLDSEVAQMRRVGDMAKIASFSREYFDGMFIEVEDE